MVEKDLYGFELESFKRELIAIFSWWADKMVDASNGGFIGRVDGHGKAYPDANKGVILNTRILWSFSAACNLGFTEYRSLADRAYNYIKEYFVDKEHGGVYWMLDAECKVLDDKKQTYAQAFAIYALAEYHQLTGSTESLDAAMSIFRVVQKHAYDGEKQGYLEGRTRHWSPLDQVALSEKEGNDAKTMNTHLHVLEAFTNLARCEKSSEVSDALQNLTVLYADRFFDFGSSRLKLFFDEDWVENYTHDSFGHEIESAWLLNEACHVLGDDTLTENINQLTLSIVERVLKEGLDKKGAVHNDRSPQGHYHSSRDWWPQAEGLIGFFDAYQKHYDERFLDIAMDIWTYIQLYFKDFEHGEWFWACNSEGIPDRNQDKAGPWKAPYHNGRMCIEMVKRLSR